MRLTDENKKKLVKIILRFIKENKDYQYRAKDKNIFDNINRLDDASTIEATLFYFYLYNIKKECKLDKQIDFIKFIEHRFLIKPNKMFDNFLKSIGLDFNLLLSHFKCMAKYEAKISSQSYAEKKKYIDIYHPHIIQTFYFYFDERDKIFGYTPRELRDKWFKYYNKNLKFNFD